MKKIILFILCVFTLTCNVFGTTYHVSDKGKEFIKDKEKLSLTAYFDKNGYSIGYGHHSNEVTEGMVITEEQANKYFDEDIKSVEKSVNRLLSKLPYTYKFSQGFIDGFASFVYNCGEYGASQSTFYQRLLKCRVNKGKMDDSDYSFTIAAVKTSRISCKGHIERRKGEYNLMKG